MQVTGNSPRKKQGDTVGEPARPLPVGLCQALEQDQVMVDLSDGERGLYAVRQGILASSLILDDGESYVCALHFPGDLVPLGWLEWEHPVTVKAVMDAEVEVFGEAALRRVFQEGSDEAFNFFSSICGLAERQREAFCIQRRRSVEGRLASFLLTLGMHLGVREGRRLCVGLPMRRCEIANYLGLRSETLSRVFARWRSVGLIEPGELRQITFPDIARLKALDRDEG